jgi:hypothetical protein
MPQMPIANGVNAAVAMPKLSARKSIYPPYAIPDSERRKHGTAANNQTSHRASRTPTIGVSIACSTFVVNALIDQSH